MAKENEPKEKDGCKPSAPVSCSVCNDTGTYWEKWKSGPPPRHWDGDEYKVFCSCKIGESLRSLEEWRLFQ